MRHLIWVAATLAALVGCAQFGPAKKPVPESTMFRVYALGDVYTGEMDDSKIRTFTSMIRDAVGPEEWLRVNSTIHMLDGAILIRTSPTGHDALTNFFHQFRTVTEHR